MSTISPTLEQVTVARPLVGPRLGRLAGVLLVIVLAQTTVMAGIRVADGVPDLVAVGVIAAGALRGPLVGGVAGFLAGLLLELTSPSATLGVLSLAYLACGAWSGRAAIEPRERGFLVPLGLVRLVLGIALAQCMIAVLHYMLGNGLPLQESLPKIILPTLVLTVVIAPPIIILVRRMLGASRVVEPSGGQ